MKKHYYPRLQRQRQPMAFFWATLLLLFSLGETALAQEKVSSKFERLRTETSKNAVKRQSRNRVGSSIQAETTHFQRNGYVTIDATAAYGQDPNTLLHSLQALGLKHGSVFGRVVSGLMPLSAITSENMDEIASLKYIWPSAMAAHVGSVTSQADQAQLSDEAKKIFKVNGKGVKVGILSDSYDNLAGADSSVLSGDLPGPNNPNSYTSPVEVLLDLEEGGSDEGRAMAEIVHDVAPGSEIAFHSAFFGTASFANGILDLAHKGSDVIVDDVIYFAEAMFQDDIIAQAVDSVGRMGVSYFSSAGNSLDKAYDATFTAAGNPTLLKSSTGDTIGTYILHDFDPSGATNAFLPIEFPGSLRAVLQWKEPYASSCTTCPGASTDLDFFLALTDGDNTSILRSVSSEDDNIGNDPVEILSARTNENMKAFILVGKKYDSATLIHNDDLQFKIVNFGDVRLPYTTEIGGTCYGHSNAASAIAVGAVRYDRTPDFGVNPPVREVFSSSGGVPIFFDKNGQAIEKEVRLKPEISAPQGGNTTFFGFDYEGDGFPNFFGTSSSAPHAAAVAALMLEYTKKKLNPGEVREAMTNTALDMPPSRTALPTPPAGTDPKFDFDTGFGLLRASHAMAAVASTPTVLSLSVVNVETGEVISKLEDNGVIDLAKLPVKGGKISLVAEAVAGKSSLKSVRFKLTGPRFRYYVDNRAPYYLLGDVAGQPRSIGLFVGKYTVQASPFTYYYGRGMKGNELELNFRVINSAVVDNYTLIDADTDEEIAPLDSVLNLSTLETRNINIRANVSSQNVEGVTLKLSGTQCWFNIGVTPPYSVFPNFWGDYLPWIAGPKPGNYKIEATTYISPYFFGTAGETTAFEFSIVDDGRSARNFRESYDMESSSERLQVSPNPSNGPVELLLPQGEADITIVNTFGRVVKKEQLSHGTPLSLNLAQYGKGVYLLQVNTKDGERYTERIMIVN